MLDITIFEGSRGCGKSTLARMMRDRISESTLINPTGFHEDGIIGIEKVTVYYDAWMDLLEDMVRHDSHVIFDRFYFSEMVYSSLYKKYSFSSEFKYYNDSMFDLVKEGVNIDIFFLFNINKEELENRLIRNKVPFATAQDTVEESMKQQERYAHMFENFKKNYPNSPIKLHYINTDGITTEDLYSEILQLKATY